MRNFINFITGHRKCNLFYALLFFSNLSLIKSIDLIQLQLDPISYSTFYLNSKYPLIQPDLVDNNFFVDSKLQIPISCYGFDQIFLKSNPDSSKTITSLDYSQGYYSFRRLWVNINTKSTSNSTLSFTANTVLYAGPTNYQTQDIPLQNYLLFYDNEKQYNSLFLYSGYHLEDNNISYINSKSGESYIGGLKYNPKFGNFSASVSYAYQIGNKPDVLSSFNYSTFWSRFNIDYSFRSYSIKLLSKLKYHKRSIDNSVFDLMLPEKSAIISYKKDRLSIDFGYEVFRGDVSPAFNIKIKRFLIYDLSYGVKRWFDYNDISVKSYEFLSLGLSGTFRGCTISLKPSYIVHDSLDYISFNSSLEYANRYFDIDLNFNYYSKDIFLFNNTSSSSITIHGDGLSFIPFVNSSDRYKPFIRFVNKYISNTGAYYFDAYKFTELNIADYYNWSNCLDFEIGIDVNNFTLFWTFKNILNEGIPIVPGAEDYYYHQFFRLAWRFDN